MSELIYQAEDNYGDTFEVEARDLALDPGEVVVFINDSVPGVILRRADVKRLRGVLKRVLKGEL